MTTHSRQNSNIVNVIPWTYTDETIDEQASRPRVGDTWITESEDELQVVVKEHPVIQMRPLEIRNYSQPLKIIKLY